MSRANKSIVVEQLFNVSVNDVWAAITKVEEMKKWFFDNIPDFEPQVGFQTSFQVRSGERTFTHLWEIVEVIPNERISYDWRYEEYEGQGLVTFELLKQGNKSLLRLTNQGLESFPNDIPEFARASCQGGWEYFIQQNLKAYLEKK